MVVSRNVIIFNFLTNSLIARKIIRRYFIIQKKEIIAKIEKEIKELSAKSKKLPKENIYYCKNGKYIQWYKVSSGSPQYIPSKNKDVIKKLVYKKFVDKRLAFLKAQQRTLAPLLKLHSRSIEEYEKMISDSHYMSLITDLIPPSVSGYKSWANMDYPRNHNHPENLIHPTVGNLIVRSKAESMIATALSNHGIPFRYEFLHTLSGIDLFPDFTIIIPSSGKMVIWEHFGLMDNEDYVNELKHKIELYAKNGFLMGDNLICSFENQAKPLSILEIEKLIMLYLE